MSHGLFLDKSLLGIFVLFLDHMSNESNIKLQMIKPQQTLSIETMLILNVKTCIFRKLIPIT